MKNAEQKNFQNGIKSAGLILRPNTFLPEAYAYIKEILDSQNIALHVECESAKGCGVGGGEAFEWLCKNCDILISLGGDGTLISVCRKSYDYQIPVLGVNAGELGFLIDVKLEELNEFISKLLIGEYKCDSRIMLKVALKGRGKSVEKIAFNDVVFSRASISSMAKIKAYVDDKFFNLYNGDGVIICTPTGSTAYNLSAGGPIVFPFSRSFILTPICPHSLTQRPIVLPSDIKIELKSSDDTVVVVDGQESYDMNEFESVVISVAPKMARLIHKKDRNYFDVLKDKLHWGDE